MWVLMGPFAILLAMLLADELLDRWLVVNKGPVGGKIRRAALVDGAKSIDMAVLTAFDWTEFKVYGPYKTRSAICEEEGLRWLECRNIPSIVEEGESLLLFRTAQNSIYMERHELNEGDFTDAPNRVLPSRAVFEITLEVRDRGYPPWVLLRLRP